MINKIYKLPGNTKKIFPVVKSKIPFEKSNYVLVIDFPQVENLSENENIPYHWSERFQAYWVYPQSEKVGDVSSYPAIELEEFGSEVHITVRDWMDPVTPVEEAVEEILLEATVGQQNRVIFAHVEKNTDNE